MNRIVFFIICVLFATISYAGTLEIIDVALDNKSFNPSEGQTVKISFEITADADVNVTIYDFLGEKIRTFELTELKSGRHSVTWDGVNSDGRLASDSVFLYVIEGQTKDGSKFVYNKASETGGIQTAPIDNYKFDSQTGDIEYVLPKTCMVRIRIGLASGMFAGTILDWTAQTAGRHIYHWDGKDTSGVTNLLKHRDLQISISCYTLPDNTIIVEVPNSTNPKNEIAETKKEASGLKPEIRDMIWSTKGKYLHYTHDPRICHSPKFTISFPTASVSGNNTPLVSGTVPIRVELDPQDADSLIDRRFEVMFFVDGIFIYEMEEGSNPFTYSWDTGNMTPGPHVVTINVLSYDDHIGVVSKKVIIENK